MISMVLKSSLFAANYLRASALFGPTGILAAFSNSYISFYNLIFSIWGSLNILARSCSSLFYLRAFLIVSSS